MSWLSSRATSTPAPVVAERVARGRLRTPSGPSACCRVPASQPGEALWIVPSRGVHTWCMRFAIDLVALDACGVVIDQVSALKPWRIRLPRRGTAGVLELPSGTLTASGTAIGHRIEFEEAAAADRRKPDEFQ